MAIKLHIYKMGKIRQTREIRNYFEISENKSTTFQNLQDVTKAVSSQREILQVNVYIKREEINQ